MRILLYTPFYPPQSQAAAVRCYWLERTLKESGYEVRTFSSLEAPGVTKLVFNPTDNKQSFLKRLIFEVLTGVELFLRILFSKHDLCILSSPPFITVTIAHFACRLSGQAYIIDVRDIYPDVYFTEGLIKENSLPGKIVKSITSSMYAHARAILSVTPGLVAKIAKASPRSKVELLINGYDKELFKPSTEKFENFTVIFHGNMGKVQNIPTIVEVAKKLEGQDVDFVFIGEGPQAEIFKGKIPRNVRYLGPKNYNEIPSLIAKAHVGFSARKDHEIGSDAFPVKVFEYVGVGIPVIMTPKSGIMTKIVSEGLFEFSNEDIEAMANKILEIKSSGGKVSLNQDLSRQGVSKKILELCHLQ